MVSIDQLADWDKIESHRRQLKWLKELRDSRVSAALKQPTPGREKAALRKLIQSSAIEHSNGSSKNFFSIVKLQLCSRINTCCL